MALRGRPAKVARVGQGHKVFEAFEVHRGYFASLDMHSLHQFCTKYALDEFLGNFNNHAP